MLQQLCYHVLATLLDQQYVLHHRFKNIVQHCFNDILLSNDEATRLFVVFGTTEQGKFVLIEQACTLITILDMPVSTC